VWIVRQDLPGKCDYVGEGKGRQMTDHTERDVRVLDGNLAAAHGVRLCRPDIISCFPITPQSPLGEALSGFVADGLLDADIVEPEGENSALSRG